MELFSLFFAVFMMISSLRMLIGISLFIISFCIWYFSGSALFGIISFCIAIFSNFVLFLIEIHSNQEKDESNKELK